MRNLMFVLLATMPAAAFAGVQESDSSTVPQRVRSVSIERGQPCPPSTGDEVVVCSVIGEPYRIPKPLRRTREVTAANQSWVNRAATADQVGRVAGGLPDTCSPVGTGGQSGCALSWNRAYAGDRAARKADAEAVPGSEESSTSAPRRVRDITLAPGETCPRSTGDEIVVCSISGEDARGK